VAATERLKPGQAREQSTGSQAPSPALTPPPGNPRFPLFDGLRAFAALGVLVFHAGEFSGGLGSGFAGRFEEVAVNGLLLFFAISGFLLYRPYVAANAAGRRGPSLGRYARRRALRIVPAYWVALTLLAIYPGIQGVFSGDWWRYYGFLQLYSGRTLGGGIPVAWTLAVEVTFYLALPLWSGLMHRLGGRRWLAFELGALALVAAGGLAVQLAATRGRVGYLVGVSLAGQCLWFSIGMTFAVLSVAVERGEMRGGALVRFVREHADVCWLVAVAAFGGLIALAPRGGLLGLIAATETRQSVGTALARIALEAVVVSGLAAPAVFGDRRLGLARRLLASRPLVWLGVISYSFYLWHLTIVELIATPGRGQGFSAPGANLLAHVHAARGLVLFVASFIATAVVASISYRFVELPFLRRKWAAGAITAPRRSAEPRG
jgi:peptidoglycan/LPS O-acetylase OafA/YrhL